MSDDVRIPAHAPFGAGRASSYRARSAGPGRSRTVVIGAMALAGVVLAGVGGWAVMGRRPAAIPIIEADSRPLRVKPDNPGGMQVAGADELVMGDGAGGSDRMAPAPEAPAPQALRAQMQQAAPQPAARNEPAATAPIPAATTPAATPPTSSSPLPDTLARAVPMARTPAQAASPAIPAATPAATPARPGVSVQLAAVDTQAAATAEWQRLTKRMPEILDGRRPTIQKAERDGHAIWRVRTGGFADMAEATGFCTRLRAKGGNCTIASF